MPAARLLLPFLLLWTTLGLVGCEPLEDDGGVVTLSGQVLNKDTGLPVKGAFVLVQPLNKRVEADSAGRYNLEVEVDSAVTLTLVASKTGFTSASVEVLAMGGRTLDVPTLQITPQGEAERTSGRPSNILLLAQTAQTIGVRESGSEEVTGITFQVADSVGRPVILNQGTTVSFLIGQGPGGGEFISPASGRTDNNGKVTANLSSGTKAGVVQVVAEMNIGGRVVRSQPVAITIHGGLPNQAHFSIGPRTFNFPGLNTLGLTNDISVIVGDKYSNPVRPGTAVYFSSTHGVVAGSTTTDQDGRGSVKLSSGNPLPANGVVVVTATTVDENRQTVVGRTPLLFTGVPVASISPRSAALNTVYTLDVADQNGNPLAAGTTISVRADGENIKVAGSSSVTLGETAFFDGARDRNNDGSPDGVRDGDALDYDDVRTGPGITRFTFQVIRAETKPDSPAPSLAAIVVTIDGPNGKLEFVLTPGGGITVRSDETRVERQGDRFVIQRVP
ncbi:MAG TPA: hypothetical protein VD948_00895 [Rhodothermales bacterium]|nr:hypothetical protein [Rhodothermales bacterium]